MPRRRNPPAIYTLEMTLWESAPRIWRRLLVPADTTLHRLHALLQATMLWEDYHLYEFEAGGKRYGSDEPEFRDEEPVLDARRTRLADVASVDGATFTYVYDFGDNWRHDLVVTSIMPLDERRTYPLCVAGARAGPPEDCGGIDAYHDLLALLKRRRGDEYDEMLTWLGGDFDPAGFDRNLVNRRLRALRHPAV